MIYQIILGMVQGIAEWLPVSSEGILVLIQNHLFQQTIDFEMMVRQALWLHLGTFLAALIYLRKDVIKILTGLTHFKTLDDETKKLSIFLIISTLISGSLGLILIKLFSQVIENFAASGRWIAAVIGCLLLVTAFLELKAKKQGHKNISDLKFIDGVILGIAQGFAVLPGLSRSGVTVSALLLRNFDKTYALKLSFLMSLPIVLAGNIFLKMEHWQFAAADLIGLFFSFLFGLLTIHFLLKLAEKINFGYFMILFGGITLLSVFM